MVDALAASGMQDRPHRLLYGRAAAIEQGRSKPLGDASTVRQLGPADHGGLVASIRVLALSLARCWLETPIRAGPNGKLATKPSGVCSISTTEAQRASCQWGNFEADPM
jgi:hypothetical protein